MLALLRGRDLKGASRRGISWRRRRLALEPEQATRVSLALGIALIAGLTAILAAPLVPTDRQVAQGLPAPRDFQAPRSITYESQVLTGRERDRAAEGVAPMYAPMDPTVAMRQAEKSRDVLRFVELVRKDPHLDRDAKLVRLGQADALAGLSQDTLGRLLDMDAEVWSVVRAEVPAVVAQVLRETIRPEAVAGARSRTITFVERTIDPVTSSVIAQVAAGTVTANTQIDDARTEEARQIARQAVEPVERSVAAGQIVAREGDILTAENVEALAQLGLLRGSFGWRDVVASLLLASVLVVVGAAVLTRLQPGFWHFPRRVALGVLLILIFAFGARYAVPDHMVLSFFYPAAAVAMTLTVLLGLETGLVAGFILAAAVGSLAGTGLDSTLYILAGSLAGSVALNRVERVSAFFTAGLAVTVTNLAVILAFTLPGPAPDLRGITELSSAAVANGVLSTGLAAVGFLTVGSILGLTTSLQLLELARPDHPLLRDLQIKAPGTYHHSIVLSNLAEGAAQAVGANTLLVRVGAYYHDVGKMVRPYFFVENQVPGSNIHSGLDAHASARIIIAHVPDGAELCEEHGLPDDVVDFVWQHHGTTQVEYFYRQAADLLGEDAVDPETFRYPGPKPQTREAAILMLADGSEAAVRAEAPESREEILEVVNKIFRKRLNAGQLDDSSLTLRDLKMVRESFVSTLQSLYHPRIKYPEDVAVPIPTESPLEQGIAPENGPASRLKVPPALGRAAELIRRGGDGRDGADESEDEPRNGDQDEEQHAAATLVEGDTEESS